MARTVLWLGGAGDTGYYKQLINPHLTQDGDKIIPIDYPASIGPVNLTPNPLDFQEGLAESVRIGEDKLAEAIADYSPSEFDTLHLGAYSLGCISLVRFLEKRATTSEELPEIHSVITVGNPLRRNGPGQGGYGLYGQAKAWRAEHQAVHAEVSNWWDLIANTPGNSVLRRIPFIVEAATGVTNADDRKNFFSLISSAWAAPYWGLSKFDIQLCQKYLDHTGHEREYLQPAFTLQIQKALAG